MEREQTRERQIEREKERERETEREREWERDRERDPIYLDYFFVYLNAQWLVLNYITLSWICSKLMSQYQILPYL